MATWEYRCQSCGSVHEVSVRPAGAMLLRCTATREWAWHDASAFVGAAVPVRAASAGAGGTGARAATRARPAKKPAARQRAAVSARKRPSRSSAGASSKRKKGRR